MHKSMVSLLALFFPALCHAEGRYLPPENIPPEIKRFIAANEKALELKSADLNGDGLQDYLLVVEKQKKNKSDDDIEERQRPLRIVLRLPDGSLKLAKSNDDIVMCSTCGGVFGDPFVGATVEKNSFTIEHYGGSAWKWANTYKFNYSRIDKTWQLVFAQDVSFHGAQPNKRTVKTYKPPKDFGKIDIADFDAGAYRKSEAK